MLCFTEPMKEETLKEIEEEPPHFNTRAYEHGPMLNKTKKLLDNFYRPHLENLSKILGDNKWMWGH